MPEQGPIVATWAAVTLDADIFSLGADLAEDVGYLGRAESWTECEALAEWDGEPNCGPSEGRPLRDPVHRHAFWLPEDADSDGLIDHVSVFVPGGIDRDVRTKLDRITRLWVERKRRADDDVDVAGTEEWRLAPEGFGRPCDFADSAPVFGCSTDWRSATPFLAAGHLKSGRHAGEFRWLVRRIGYGSGSRFRCGKDRDPRAAGSACRRIHTSRTPLSSFPIQGRREAARHEGRAAPCHISSARERPSCHGLRKSLRPRAVRRPVPVVGGLTDVSPADRDCGHIAAHLPRRLPVVGIAADRATADGCGEKRYADKYRGTGQPVYLIAVEFSKDTRNLTAFEVERA